MAADISRVTANILHIAAGILRVVADKAVEEAKSSWPKKIVFTFLKIFWGIFNGENTLFQKVLKKWASFRKKSFIFSPL